MNTSTATFSQLMLSPCTITTTQFNHHQQMTPNRHPFFSAPTSLSLTSNFYRSLCDHCNRGFHQWKALQLDRRRAHDIISSLALRVRGTQCVICKSHLGSRCHLMEHLSKRLYCALNTMAQVPAMTHTHTHEQHEGGQASTHTHTRRI
eukprot:5503536-Amphidinium_carterae.1